jgi:hypothetical protein
LKRRDGWDHPAGVRSEPTEVLDLQVTRNSLERALLFMDTLLKSLESSGFTARVDKEKGKTLLIRNGTTMPISIVEHVPRSNHTLTPAEERARKRYFDSFRVGPRLEYPSIPQFDWHPTGRLTLTVGSWPSRKWNDTDRSLIDSRLHAIVAGIVGLAEEKRAEEEEEARRPAAARAVCTRHPGGARLTRPGQVATMFASMLDSDYVQKPVFIKNFFNDFRKVASRQPARGRGALGPGAASQLGRWRL